METPGPAHCGSKPKRIAVGIAPLGTISIGIVPMGVVCIGIVPMGVVSIGVVAMGVINFSVVGMGLLAVGLNTMGVWTAGPESHGLVDLGGGQGGHHNHQGHHSGPEGAATGAEANMLAYPTREEAEAKAKQLGCSGVHRMGSFWMPCENHPGS
ncbi:uncharacterized conserved membrane protein (DUF3721) [Synechococcus sp. RS9909]|uniref:hypothetical protein n=1 Tax=unclassified Synechococcus TaxID=2626047 RepID=UPI000068F798|nr:MULTISPECIES: hypothetical protein [unclassified Synechococcus]EAQ69375.1 hypothetical protein RS9917_13065 [Synechococcus sp. RS9917]QNI79370.1 uncharacterized conserved membrane protein (DUF3721) [Synechococcus sp. RS9909]